MAGFEDVPETVVHESWRNDDGVIELELGPDEHIFARTGDKDRPVILGFNESWHERDPRYTDDTARVRIAMTRAQAADVIQELLGVLIS